MSLFETQKEGKNSHLVPLAEKMRPQTLKDFIGQVKVIGKKSWLREALKAEAPLPNMIFWGPPGTGKTSLARLFSKNSKAFWLHVNAVDTGAKALREMGHEGHKRKIEKQQQTCLFIDEIHRLNKSQQDVLLPFIEAGDLNLIGATTENPSYEMTPAFLSRVKVLIFEALPEDQLEELLEKSLKIFHTTKQEAFEKEALDKLLSFAKGDARQLLNSLELIMSQKKSPQAVDVEFLENILSYSPNYYGEKKEEAYNCISAFIKSMRGSDPDASLYYLARMLESGESPTFIARRLMIFASEDVGNADPRALTVATSGMQAVEKVGLPECGINLAQVTTYLACAPKSNRSYKAFLEAKKVVQETGTTPAIPHTLRSGQNTFCKNLGYGKDYKYSHDGQKGYVPQNYLPQKLSGLKLYEPSSRGFEKNINEYLKWMKEKN